MGKKVLVVYHTLGGNTEAAAKLVAGGIESVPGVAAVLKRAGEADASDLRDCAGYCFGTPDYFSYMAGMLKDFFDRTFYPTQGELDDRPCGIFVTHGGGGKAQASVEQLCRSFRLKCVAGAVLVRGKPAGASEEELRALGIAVAKAVL
jgi:multimeric flavodoxin WrbA